MKIAYIVRVIFLFVFAFVIALIPTFSANSQVVISIPISDNFMANLFNRFIELPIHSLMFFGILFILISISGKIKIPFIEISLIPMQQVKLGILGGFLIVLSLVGIAVPIFPDVQSCSELSQSGSTTEVPIPEKTPATPSNPPPASNQTVAEIERELIDRSYPLEQCGDKNVDPDRPHPVYVEFTQSNLTKIKKDYCKDALRYRRPSGKEVIQVASFKDRQRAQVFAKIMIDKVGSGILAN